MYPSGGQMSGSYYDPRAGYTPPCCGGGNGYSYNNYYYPPGPVTPYRHLYPSPHPYVAALHPLMQPCCHHPHYHPMPGTPAPANCYVASEACTPIQHQQQQTVWRPVIVPPSSCCCGHPNYASYYGNPLSGGFGNDAKVSNGNVKEDVMKVDDSSARPVLLNGGSNSSQPQLFWIPPQYVSNLQQQGADKVHQDGKTDGQMIPLDLHKLTSLLNKDSNKPVTACVRKDLPSILMPSNSKESRESSAMNKISEIEEKPSIYNNAGSLKLLDNGDVVRKVLHEPVQTSEPRSDSVSQVIQNQYDKVRVKDIPVKEAEDISEKKTSTNAAVGSRSRSRSVSPIKKSKLPPVCLRVDPLPRKKNGNGTIKPQQTAQTGNAAHNITDNTKNVEVVEASSKESPKDNPVLDETGNVKNRRENINEGNTMDSKKYAQPEITPAGFEEGYVVKARETISEETAAVRIQSAYRGYEERKWHSLQKLRQIAKVREQISGIKDRIQALENNADMNKDEFERRRLVIGETIMSHLLTLDTIQGLHPSIRDVRKSVARELITLQEKLDLFHAQRNAGDVQEDKHQENEGQNMTAIDGSVDKTEILTESVYAALQQEETFADNAHMETQVVTQLMGDSPRQGEEVMLNFNTGNEADLKLMSSPDQGEDSGKEITEGIILEEQLLKGGNDSYVAEDSGKQMTEGIILEEQLLKGGNDSYVAELVSEHASTAQSVELAVYPQEVKETNPISCATTGEIGEDNLGVVTADGIEQVSKSGDEPAVEECGVTIEHECNHVEQQPKQQAVECESEMSDEQETIAISTCASEEVIHTMEDAEKSAAPFEEDDEHETPRLSNVSQTSTVNTDSVVLAEENDKLRETVRKLLEAEKDQLAVITTLNEKLRNVEKKLKKKRNRKLKVHKSSNKNHETYDQNMPICTM